MANISISEEDENIVLQVRSLGFRTPEAAKYGVLRLALAKSLKIETPPESGLDTIEKKGRDYDFREVTGVGKSENDKGLHDFDDAIRALLSVYHQEDLFASDQRYKLFLQRHIRRGLREIRTSWSSGHNFINWLREELFQDLKPDNSQLAAATETDLLLNALVEIGVHSEVRDIKQGIRLDRYALYLANINHLDNLKKGLAKLSFRLGLPENAITLSGSKEAGVANLDIPRSPEHWKIVSPARMNEWADLPHKEKLPVWLGQTVLGENFSMDLAEAPHVLLAGATGSGKTVCLHSLICSLLRTQSREKLQFALIDPKGTELNVYAKLPDLFGGFVAKSTLEAANMLDELVETMEARNRLFVEMGVRDIDEASKKSALPRIVVVVEELADLLMQSRELETPLVRLAQKARSTGIHLVLATQRPDAVTFSGLLRSNIPVRIALRVQKHTESSIILDQKGAEALLGRGDMLIKLTDQPEPVRVHGARVGDSEIALAIQKFCR
ncbi:S-DNA-T family DNA segregation ATPase FtsK/SpoIIIE [Methylobacter tundripaludum]|uniref:S-DNA-T family DNA segregation ATPase FtsK/SpoIIIE n=1 Tax=Methylobacter tundripaludum TaxID=173365 RepID=A0A2S6H8U2_9GAMM|nr:S-DNA-T family DNA segregation ATPase FtsK/SpoIIIE [Methylobacter tundripaludum]